MIERWGIRLAALVIVLAVVLYALELAGAFG